MKLTVKSILASAGLSVLFLVVYSLCNWLTSFRHGVGSYYFVWERHIPFVPALIVPYMSIDLFFIAAPLLVRSERELSRLVWRIAAAILLAGASFLIFPMKFGFERPRADGLPGLIFNSFRRLDLPYNQCPSLHVALCVILLRLYLSRTRGWVRIVLGGWFALIFISTLLTYQHHSVDILGGLLLAGITFCAVPEGSNQLPFAKNYRVAGWYLLGSISCTVVGLLSRLKGLILIWPAISMLIVSAAYFGIMRNIFRKEAGRIPISTYVLLWPVLLGQRLSLDYYARQCAAYHQLIDHLWIGRRLSNKEAGQAIRNGVCSVVDLTSEIPEPRLFCRLNYFSLPLLDLTAPSLDQIDQAIEFINCQQARGVVYLHCKAGYSRTAVIAGAYLLATGRAGSVEEAIAMLRSVRPTLIVRPEAMKALSDYQSRREINAVAVAVEPVALKF